MTQTKALIAPEDTCFRTEAISQNRDLLSPLKINIFVLLVKVNFRNQTLNI